ncbi:coiled-coil and C2 domain-containing protein 1A [Hyperolius riggenbachi]|uniref:coiled-coil and C2 domain-containing protein 1A n=1 Tax=Hyperolius riggenbachi TaxID=752182 RepID=UPI0035A278B8
MSGQRGGRRGGGGRPPAKGAPFLLGGFPQDDGSDDDGNLEAELMAITGGNKAANKPKPKGKTPLPMEHIEKMAALCMQDVEEDDDEDLEDDEDLMAELDDVLAEDDIKEEPRMTSAPAQPSRTSAGGGIEGTLSDRLAMYKEALANAKQAGEGTKVRRYDRGVKTLEDLLRTAKKGGSVSPEDIPPPVAVGKSGSSPAPSPNAVTTPDAPVKPIPPSNGIPPQAPSSAIPPPVSSRAPPPVPAKPQSLPKPVIMATPAMSSAPVISSAPATPSPVADGHKAQILERQRQYKLAALKSKQEGDAELASKYYRISLDPMVSALDSGQSVDLKGLPPPIARTRYMQLYNAGCSGSWGALLIAGMEERYEKLAEECMKYIEIVKQAHTRGLPVPRCHYEERTLSIVKMFPDLTSSDLILYVSKLVNLPTPAGSSPSDMDTFVRFEFAYPSTEEAQRDKTNVIKGTNSPAFKEKFKLHINRNHRGLKRAVQAKGIKFEIIQKGGLFKSDRIMGTAHLKLEALETNCEVRDILEVVDGRKPTGAKLEVCVQIRDPLSSQQLSSTTEKWLVVEPMTLPPASVPKPKQSVPMPNKPAPSSAPAFHCLSVLAYEKEKIEKKILAYRQQHRQPPEDLLALLNDVIQKSKQQIQLIRQGEPAIKVEYMRHLERSLQFYSDSARRLGQEGNRDAAKEALLKRNLVGNELQQMKG